MRAVGATVLLPVIVQTTGHCTVFRGGAVSGVHCDRTGRGGGVVRLVPLQQLPGDVRKRTAGWGVAPEAAVGAMSKDEI